MSRVNTVLGPIAAEELGLVAVHEHIGYGMPGSELDIRWWKTPEQRYEETVPKLRQFAEYSRAHGGCTFVDATGICNGRDVDYYQSLSVKTGVHIVAATGFVGGDTALRFFAEASVDYLMRQFVHEITVGIGGTGSLAGISSFWSPPCPSPAQRPAPPFPRGPRSPPPPPSRGPPPSGCPRRRACH